MATTITSAPTNAAATGYSNQKHGCTLSEGTLVVVEADTTTNGKFYYSQNGGTSWTSYGSDIGGWANGSIAAYVDSGGTERLVAIWLQSGTSGTGPTGGARTDGSVYVATGAFNSLRTTITWGAAVSPLGFSAGITLGYPDIDVVPDSTGGLALCAISYVTSAPSVTVQGYRIVISNTGVCTVGANLASTAVYTATSAPTFPSVVANQVTKDMYVAWSAGKTGAGAGIRFRLMTYGSSTWTAGSEVEVDNTVYVENATDAGIVCRWDAGRSLAVIGSGCENGAAQFFVRVWDSSNFTTFTNRSNVSQANVNANWGFGMTIDAATGDIYTLGSTWNGSAYVNVGYYKLTRSGSTLASGALVTTDAFVGVTTPPYVYAWFSGSTIRWIYRKGSSSPYPVVYDQLVLNTSPTIAYGASSLADASFPNTATPTLTAYVTDPDSSQTLTVTYEVATDSGFASIVYTGTNTAASPQTAGAVSKTTTALSKATLYYWRARVSDGTATSANTTTRTFTIYDNPVVAIGASTPATTVSTGGPTLNVGWTYTQGQSLAEAFYRVQVQTNGGATTYYDTGTLAGPATSVALDAVALAIPTDTTATALQVVVTTTAATTGTVITATKTFDIQWGVVTVGIVSPTNGAIVATTGITAQWTFASTRSKLQGSYRIRLMIASTGSVLLDTGFVTSAATSVAVAVVLVDGSTYSLEVTLKNDQGVLGT